jgi:hypothetical protein
VNRCCRSAGVKRCSPPAVPCPGRLADDASPLAVPDRQRSAR